MYAIRRITGLETTTEGIPVQGCSIPDILTIMMRRAGATRARIRESLPEIQRAAERYYLRVCPLLHDKHCPASSPCSNACNGAAFCWRWLPAT